MADGGQWHDDLANPGRADHANQLLASRAAYFQATVEAAAGPVGVLVNCDAAARLPGD